MRCIKRLCALDAYALDHFAELTLHVTDIFTLQPYVNLIGGAASVNSQVAGTAIGITPSTFNTSGHERSSDQQQDLRELLTNIPRTSHLYAEVLSTL